MNVKFAARLIAAMCVWASAASAQLTFEDMTNRPGSDYRVFGVPPPPPPGHGPAVGWGSAASAAMKTSCAARGVMSRRPRSDRRNLPPEVRCAARHRRSVLRFGRQADRAAIPLGRMAARARQLPHWRRDAGLRPAEIRRQALDVRICLRDRGRLGERRPVPCLVLGSHSQQGSYLPAFPRRTRRVVPCGDVSGKIGLR